jgi:hypothetical protein
MVGKIERRRPARQIDDLAAWRQGIDAIGEQLGAHPIEEIPIVRLSGSEQLTGALDLALVA